MPRVIFQPIEIITYQTDHFVCPLQGNTFFEIVWVESGAGFRVVGNHQLPFTNGAVLLHLPTEEILIQLNTLSVIHFIKFQKVYFDSSIPVKGIDVENWFNSIEFILFSGRHRQETLVKNDEERKILIGLIQTILYESKTKGVHFDVNIRASLTAVLNIIARNLGPSGSLKPENKDILNYINFHITDTDKLSVKNLAQVFTLSPAYFGEYFKKKYGISLRDYILEYKLKLAENRLLYTNDTIAEIADFLQFSDTSHFNKTFKHHRGRLPSSFRK